MNESKEAKKIISLTVPAKLLEDFEEVCDENGRTRGNTLLVLMGAYAEKRPKESLSTGLGIEDVREVARCLI